MEAREPARNAAALKGAHILMVDDEVSSTCLMTNFLNRIGYTQLRSINDSRRAFEAIETFVPDLILLDLNMPVLISSSSEKKIKRLHAVGHDVERI